MKKLFTLLIPAIFALCSCDMDMKEAKLPVNTTLPLTDFNISETTLLSWAGLKDEVNPGKDGVLEINKKMEMTIGTPADLKSIFTIADQNISIPVNLGGIVPAPVEIEINPPLKLEDPFVFPAGYYIKSAQLDRGTISLRIMNSISDFSGTVCTVEQLTNNGIPLTIRPGEIKSLQGYKLEFKDNSSLATFVLSGKITAKAGDNLSNIRLEANFTNLEIKEAEGFFGRNVIAPQEEFTINIDKGVTDFFGNCEYYLSDPHVKLRLNNTYDLPILVRISKLQIGGKEVELKNMTGGDKILVKPKAVTEYLLDNTSTVSGKGLSEAISLDMSRITVAFTVITNPTKEDTGDNNYTPPAYNKISQLNNISVDEYITIPLDGWFTGIPFNHEFDMNLDIDDDEKVYDYFKIAVICNNEMPLELDFTLKAVDGNSAEHILFSEPIVIPASNGLNPRSGDFKPGVITEGNAAIRTIPGDKVKLLMQSNKLRFDIKGEMPKKEDGKSMKFYTRSNLQLKLIGNLKGEF